MIAVKIKGNGQVNSRTRSPFNLAALAGVETVRPLRKTFLNARNAPSILDGVYWVDIQDELHPVDFCNQLLNHPEVIYAEPIFREEPLGIPNDPLASPTTGNQGYLDVIHAYDAWDITTGSSDIVIGIVDTGMNLFHEDLVGKFYQNVGEAPLPNGIDDDGNGYVDDITGFDFADNDPNANADGSQHGTHVGGIAGASTNNGVGMAGVGYNTPVSALKGFTTIGTVSTGVWEGVLYAAENGYDIANLSWGSFGSYSQLLQDIVTYCVLEKDMVVIAAAGNTNADLDFYPASYEHVLSVAGTTLTDTKWGNSTFGHHVDITAPALSILSTQNENNYGTDSGTSHAAPQVAGAAALVKSVFTQYNARQIMEQLRVTSDDIYHVSGNEAYAYKLGKGRLNVYRAVTETFTRSLRVHNFEYSNGFGKHAFFGDTITLQFELTNYLAGLNSPTVRLESESPYITILTPQNQPGSFQTMETKPQGGWQILLDNDTPPDTEIDLRFVMEEGSYSDYQNISFKTNPNYFDFGNGNMALRVIGDGSLCYSDATYATGSEVIYNGLPVLRYAGLLLATSADNVQDNVTNTFSIPRSRDDDFQGDSNMKLLPHEVLPYFGYSTFSSKDDAYFIEQSIIPSDEKSSVIISYRIVNTSGVTINELHAGLFADYFLANQTDNRAIWDATTQSLVFYDQAENTFAGLKLLAESYHYAALDMQAGNGNTRDIQNSFSDPDKFTWMTNANKGQAGMNGAGNDVAGLVSRSFSGLAAGESIDIAFVLSLAGSYAELTTNLEDAAVAYDQFKSHPPVIATFYSCEGGDVVVNPLSGTTFAFYQDPEATIDLGIGEQFTVTHIMSDSAIYVRNLDGTFASATRKIRIKVLDQVGQFSTSTDTLYLDHPTINTITFIDESFQPVTWQWDFGNGVYSSNANPTINFSESGNYTISLTVTSAIGCADEVSKQIVVAARTDPPILEDVFLCQNELFELQHPTEAYVLYSSSGAKLAKGTTVTVGPFASTTTLRVAQVINGFESLTTDVTLTIDPLEAAFTFRPDLESNEHRVLFTASSNTASNWSWLINGTEVSTANELSHLADDTPFELELVVSNNNCTASLQHSISFTPSPTPIITSVFVCHGESALIHPQNGTYFAFYADENLTNLLGKGTSFTIPNVTADQLIYVLGLDNILPSEAVEVPITVETVNVDILANPAQLILSESKVVRFSVSEQTVTSAQWFVNGELVESNLSPTLLFDEPGQYEIRLVATNATNCEVQSTILYEVVATVTGIDPIHWNIYPNPVWRGMTLQLGQFYDQVDIYSLDGKRCASQTLISSLIIAEDIEPGVYVLTLRSGDSAQKIKLLIQ
jgi:subtilisin family serine protease/PKD repeat protein